MGNKVVERHQVAGLDEKERGFNRQIDVERIDGGYRAVLRYEQTLVETTACETSVQTVDELVRMLRERGYTQLRSRLNFQGAAYLGTQEPWIEYPDPNASPDYEAGIPAEQLTRRTGWIGKVLQLFRS
ncbi:MAG TPA: hypothetical protein VJV04_06150 [Nitrospiraceae bacterium]|nr:hypothetical protein [Nitrospiraceae bacterium]